MSPNAVLSFPYEGALYYLLNQHIDWVPNAAVRPAGYYRVLFGAEAELTKSKATALGALFEEIILVGADAFLPDRESSTKDGNYWHPDFRIRVPNSHYAEWHDENVELAERLLESTRILGVFRFHYAELIAPHDRLQMLCRLLLQMHAAQVYDAVVVGDSRLCALHDAVLAELHGTSEKKVQGLDSKVLALDSYTLRIVGLEFNCPDTDAFAAVRQSKEIRVYANQFRGAISIAKDSSDVTKELLSLMKEARDTGAIANKVAAGFETGSTVVSVAGLIPFVGTVAGIVGLGTDALARTARHTQFTRDWYAIGSHMQRVALDSLLSKT